MLQELFITHCATGTLIMNPFIKNSSINVVNFCSRGWGEGKCFTVLEQGLPCSGKWFAGEVQPFVLQFVIIWLPGGCSSF